MARPGYTRPPGYDPNAARRRRGPAPTKFVGVDGEGWTDEAGVHRYAQLSVGDRTLFGWEHLDFLEIANFLWDCFQDQPDAAYVGFYLGYDFSQWLRTLPIDRAAMLLTQPGIASRRRTNSHGNTIPFPVEYGGYLFDMLGDKRFKIVAWDPDKSDPDRHIYKPAGPWMNICDTGPFFQASFLSVIDPKGWPDGAPCSDEDYSTILEGKSHRADDWTTATWLAAEADLTRYNVAENRVLAAVMGRYEEGLTAAGVKLRKDQWYGPGAAAQDWMGKKGLATAENVNDNVPRDVLEFARESYHGGWFEIFAHGIIAGESFEYDLNSAYPAAMVDMPCWLHCRYDWSSHDRLDDLPGLALVDCTTTGSDPRVGSALHRRKNGTILRPGRTRGVRWAHELRAGVAAGVIDDIIIHRAVAITPGCPPEGEEGVVCDALSTGIPVIYRDRLRVGKNTAHGKAFKLIYNSAYGKQAQSIGSPKFSNPLSASFITSWCRTRILEAIATHPTRTKDLLMVATDGVYFRTPHPTLPISPSELGKWDASTKSNLTILMPGIYYDDSGRRAAQEGAFAKLRSRGIPGSALAASIDVLDREFQRLLTDPTAEENWPSLKAPIKFQVQSPTQALSQGKWNTAGTVARDVQRKLSTNPISKRYPPGGLDVEARAPYVTRDGYVRTFPYQQDGDGVSTPYSKRFGLQGETMDLGLTPDGPAMLELLETLQSKDVRDA